MGDKHAGPVETSVASAILGLGDLEGEGRDCPGVFSLYPPTSTARNRHRQASAHH